MKPVVQELDNLELRLTIVDENIKSAKEQLKKAGLPVGLINPKGEIDKEVHRWLKS